MPLNLNCHYKSGLPLEVDGIHPEAIQSLNRSSILSLPVWRGRRKERLIDFFDISGDLQDGEIVWTGNLSRVHRIGEGMTAGVMVVTGSCGRHAGEKMTGGLLKILGNAGDYLGVAMTGGKIHVSGDVGDHAAGVLPGAKLGVNRGEILIRGNAGRGLAESMRRGTIVVGGTVGELAAWNIIAGTVISLGGFGKRVAVGMKRGTIVDAKENSLAEARRKMLPTFKAGITGKVPVLEMLANWLRRQVENEGEPFFPAEDVDRLSTSFQLFHGDQLRGGNGEVFWNTVDV